MTEENNNTPNTEETKEETTTTDQQPSVDTTPQPSEEQVEEVKEVKEEVKEEVAEVKTEVVKDFSALRPGATVRVHQKIKETNSKGEEKERIQVYEGIILARNHGVGQSATVTVRKISDGIGVEKIFPLHSTNIAKFEVVKQAKVRRAKLYFLRNWKKRLTEVITKK